MALKESIFAAEMGLGTIETKFSSQSRYGVIWRDAPEL